MKYPKTIYVCRGMNMSATELLGDNPHKTCPLVKTGKCDDGFKCRIIKYNKVKT